MPGTSDRFGFRYVIDFEPKLGGREVAEVEFSDDQGRTYAVATLRFDQLIRLLHRPLEQAA